MIQLYRILRPSLLVLTLLKFAASVSTFIYNREQPYCQIPRQSTPDGLIHFLETTCTHSLGYLHSSFSYNNCKFFLFAIISNNLDNVNHHEHTITLTNSTSYCHPNFNYAFRLTTFFHDDVLSACGDFRCRPSLPYAHHHGFYDPNRLQHAAR